MIKKLIGVLTFKNIKSLETNTLENLWPRWHLRGINLSFYLDTKRAQSTQREIVSNGTASRGLVTICQGSSCIAMPTPSPTEQGQWAFPGAHPPHFTLLWEGLVFHHEHRRSSVTWKTPRAAQEVDAECNTIFSVKSLRHRLFTFRILPLAFLLTADVNNCDLRSQYWVLHCVIPSSDVI